MTPQTPPRLAAALVRLTAGRNDALLAGYGVVGLLMVPFLILRLSRTGPLAERPISLSLGR